MNHIASMALVAALALTACASPAAAPEVSSSPEVEATSASPTPTGPPVAATFPSVEALRDAVVATGYPCPNWEQHDRVTRAVQSGSCSDSDVFSIYLNEAEVSDAADALEALGGGSTLLLGPNWLINAEEAHLEGLQAGLGGAIRILDGEEVSEPGLVELSTDDFKVGVKVLKKKCYGSAGCNVTFRIVPKYVGVLPLPETGTIEVTYEVKGGEDPLVNTFTIEGGSASYDAEELIGTRKSSAKLKAVVLDVTHSE